MCVREKERLCLSSPLWGWIIIGKFEPTNNRDAANNVMVILFFVTFNSLILVWISAKHLIGTSQQCSPVFSHTKHVQINNLHIFTIVFPSHSVSTRSSDSLVLPITYVRSSLGKRAFSVTGPRLWNSLPPDTLNSSSLPIFRSKLKTPLLQNCVPSLGSFPSPWTVYPDFDSCCSHFMPYRMTPSVRHRAIEVHY